MGHLEVFYTIFFASAFEAGTQLLGTDGTQEGVLTLQAEDFTVPALVASGRNVTIASGAYVLRTRWPEILWVGSMPVHTCSSCLKWS